MREMLFGYWPQEPLARVLVGFFVSPVTLATASLLRRRVVGAAVVELATFFDFTVEPGFVGFVCLIELVVAISFAGDAFAVEAFVPEVFTATVFPRAVPVLGAVAAVFFAGDLVVAVFATATFVAAVFVVVAFAVVALACLAGVIGFLGVTVVAVVSLSLDGVLINLAVCKGVLVFGVGCIFVPVLVADFFILFIFFPVGVLVLETRTPTV
jgi:hypothetical protein